VPTILRAILVFFVAVLLTPLAAVATGALVLEVPQDMTVEAKGSIGTRVTYTVSAHTADGRLLPVTCDRGSGSSFPLGETTVECSATDLLQNETVVKQFRVTVVDRTPPSVSVPISRTVRTRNHSGAKAHFVATAVDLVDGSVAAKCSPSQGARLPLGTTSVICTASDQRGNTGSRAFKFTVLYVLYSPTSGDWNWISRPPLLAWFPVPGASYYNVQVFRRGEKILSAWPSLPNLRMRRSWEWGGRTFQFTSGYYSWAVFPGFGKPEQARYGRLLGTSSFLVVSRD
jgi:hypothetical protein